MDRYTPAQVEIIKNAIRKARETVERAQRYELSIFAQTFVDNDGVQIPGQPGNEAMQKLVAEQLLESLKTGRATSDDTTVLCEIKRARSQLRWASAAASDKVVGFHLKLGPGAAQHAACRELLNQDYGLGAAVFPKERIVVLPAICDDYQFIPVLEDEVEQ